MEFLNKQMLDHIFKNSGFWQRMIVKIVQILRKSMQSLKL